MFSRNFDWNHASSLSVFPEIRHYRKTYTESDISCASKRKLFSVQRIVGARDRTFREPLLNVALYKRKASTQAETRGLLISTLAARVTSAKHTRSCGLATAVFIFFFRLFDFTRQERQDEEHAVTRAAHVRVKIRHCDYVRENFFMYVRISL